MGNENISTYTIDQLGSILHCRIEDIAEYREQKTPPDA